MFVAAALALTVPHLLARPHVLALPVMVAWVGGMIAAADRRGAPSFWLLPLMMLWANLHGGFVFGLRADRRRSRSTRCWAPSRPAQKSLLLRWAAFGLAALAASCARPMAGMRCWPRKRSSRSASALPLIMEWKPADFGSLGAFEICLLLGIGLALYRGIKLPPMRIVLLLGLVHMALAQGRAAEILALLAPLILAAPLARQIGGAEPHVQCRVTFARRAVRKPSALRCWRRRWRMHRCIVSSRTPAARRSRRSPS